MTSEEDLPVVLHAEQEHTGIRIVVFASLFLAYILSFQLVVWLIGNVGPPGLADYTIFISCVGAIIPAVLVVWGIEKLLKGVWHSGLTVSLDDKTMTVQDEKQSHPNDGNALDDNQGFAFRWDKPINMTNWAFRLDGYPRGGRERRVSAKSWCLASEFQQNDLRLGVYCFMPHQKAESWVEDQTQADSFHVINQADIYDKTMQSRFGPPTRPSISTSLLHSKDGRYWLAERRRWEAGIELTPEDFQTLHTMIAGQANRDQIDTAATDNS